MLIKLTNGDSVTIVLNHIDEPHSIVVSNHDGQLHHREFHVPIEQRLEFPTLEEINDYYKLLEEYTLDTKIDIYNYIKNWLEDNNVI